MGKHRDNQSTRNKWEVYPDSQKKALLEEFRRKHPDDHYDQELLLAFLQKKLLRN